MTARLTPTALAAVDRRSNRSSSINLPMQNNFQFNLHWNEPNPCTLQTSRPAASAVGSQNQQALKHFGEFHIISITESLDGFRYLIESRGNAIHQPKKSKVDRALVLQQNLTLG
jgi:hypothetical protein